MGQSLGERDGDVQLLENIGEFCKLLIQLGFGKPLGKGDRWPVWGGCSAPFFFLPSASSDGVGTVRVGSVRAVSSCGAGSEWVGPSSCGADTGRVRGTRVVSAVV